MHKEVIIGNRPVGEGHPSYIIGEIGINHNGSLDIAKSLIAVAKNAGCDAVKFQKRTIDIVYTAKELATPRENPFGATNGDLKRGLEFGEEQYRKINDYCEEMGIVWFASCWDEPSVDFINLFPVPCYKVASASLTDDNLLLHTRATGKPMLLSTGMSTIEEIDHAVEIVGKENLILIHTTSTYPANYDELDLLSRDTGCPWATRGTRPASPPPWQRLPLVPVLSNAISPWNDPCGDPIRLLRSAPAGSPN